MTIRSDVNAEVKWEIKFEPGRVAAAVPLLEDTVPSLTPESVSNATLGLPPAPDV